MDYEQLGKRKRKEKILIRSNTKNTSSGDASNYDHGRGVEQMVRDMAVRRSYPVCRLIGISSLSSS